MNNFKSTHYTFFVVNSLFDIARLCVERLITKPPYQKLLAMIFYYDNAKRQNHQSKLVTLCIVMAIPHFLERPFNQEGSFLPLPIPPLPADPPADGPPTVDAF